MSFDLEDSIIGIGVCDQELGEFKLSEPGSIHTIPANSITLSPEEEFPLKIWLAVRLGPCCALLSPPATS